MADDLVLLALDGGRDGAELLGVAAAQGVEQEGVLDCDRGVEIAAQGVADDVELAAAGELDGAGAAVDLIGGAAHLLIVVGGRHGTAPVHHERLGLAVGDANGADVHVARRTTRAHLERDLGEVGLLEQEQDVGELLDADVVVLVVGVDHGVQGLDRGEGLHGLVGAAEVDGDLLGQVDQVLSRAVVAGLDLLGQVVAQGHKLGVYLAEVGLFRLERLVVHLLVCHGPPPCCRYASLCRLGAGRAI